MQHHVKFTLRDVLILNELDYIPVVDYIPIIALSKVLFFFYIYVYLYSKLTTITIVLIKK